MPSSAADGRPELAVGAVVAAADHLLLVTRRNPPSAGLWTVPGGRVERGELLADAVEREVAEETGIDVRCGPLVGWVERLSDDHHFVILDFEATLTAGPVSHGSSLPPLRAGDDAGDARWIPLDAVPSMPLVAGLLDFLVTHRVVAAR